jgi:peptide/nickel transport system permease protein
VAATLGITLGLIAGYFGGASTAVIMRIADVQLTFPAILIALLIDGVVRGLISVQPSRRDRHLRRRRGDRPLLLGAVCPHRARLGDGREEQGICAGGALIGLSPLLIMFRHVLPNVTGPVLVIATINLALAIITEATLSFLGVGLPPTQPSLGTLIRIGNEVLQSGDCSRSFRRMVDLVLAVNLLGDWLRDALNPKLR